MTKAHTWCSLDRSANPFNSPGDEGTGTTLRPFHAECVRKALLWNELPLVYCEVGTQQGFVAARCVSSFPASGEH